MNTVIAASIDSVQEIHRISVTLRHSVLDALALRRQGCTAKEI